MVEDRTRVDFNAPTSLVERADALAQLLDTSRTQLLVDALRDELDALARNEDVRREIREGFYDERVDFETVESVMGTEEALRMGLLRASLSREAPEPHLEELPGDEAFYEGDLPEWRPDEDDGPDDDSEPKE